MNRLIQILKNNGVLKSPDLEQALVSVDRKDFVPQTQKEFAYVNQALPIGFGQTISQPYVVIFMLELLELQPGQKVIEVGFGSAWQTGILAELTGESGHVYAFELVPELCASGKANLAKYPRLLPRSTLMCASARSLPSAVPPCERLISAAAITEVPQEWREKLLPGGVMVYPKGYSVWKESKMEDGTFSAEEYPGFVFVPFV